MTEAGLINEETKEEDFNNDQGFPPEFGTGKNGSNFKIRAKYPE